MLRVSLILAKSLILALTVNKIFVLSFRKYKILYYIFPVQGTLLIIEGTGRFKIFMYLTQFEQAVSTGKCSEGPEDIALALSLPPRSASLFGAEHPPTEGDR